MGIKLYFVFHQNSKELEQTSPSPKGNLGSTSRCPLRNSASVMTWLEGHHRLSPHEQFSAHANCWNVLPSLTTPCRPLYVNDKALAGVMVLCKLTFIVSGIYHSPHFLLHTMSLAQVPNNIWNLVLNFTKCHFTTHWCYFSPEPINLIYSSNESPDNKLLLHCCGGEILYYAVEFSLPVQLLNRILTTQLMESSEDIFMTWENAYEITFSLLCFVLFSV